MKKIDLNGQWNLYAYQAYEKDITTPDGLSDPDLLKIPCTVPGNVELDLQAAGYLPDDLMMGMNMLEAEKYETYEWWYERSFEGVTLSDGQRAHLHFEGVDCFAEYFLNGKHFGSSDNMFLPQDFDVTELLVPGENLLQVRIRSALLEETDMDVDIYSAGAGWHGYTHSTQVRKPPHCYGWDIMPRALSAGLWRSVSLDIHEECEFNQVYIFADRFFGRTTDIRFVFDIKLPHRLAKEELYLHIHGECGDSVVDVKRKIIFKAGCIVLWENDLKKWWPYGYGEQNLYDFELTVLHNDTPIAKHNCRVGIRTVELDRKQILEDGKTGGFRFIVNGVPIVCKGMNWVPLEVYHSQDHKRYRKALELASDIGCNIMRCWGGNVYEDEEFFDYCDEHGILIWQDFAMACHLYPQNERMFTLLKKEAEVIIKRLRQHPSLAIWVGDNECDLIHQGTGWNVDPNIANKLNRELLPDMVRMHDRNRPYLESSPFVSKEVHDSGRYDLMPESHLWGPRDYYKSDYYRLSRSVFVSETGYHGCPSPEYVKKFIHPDHVWPNDNDPEWIFHSTDQKNNPARLNLMASQVKQFFGRSMDNLEDFAFASQVSQAEADKYFIERIRLQKDSGGILLWNLLDGWPQFSDAVVGYYFDKKIAYYYIKRCQAPFAAICGEVENLNIPIYLVNDSMERVSGHLRVYDGETDETLYECDYSVGANENLRYGSFHCDYSDRRLVILRYDSGFNHYITGSIPFDFDQYKKWYAILKKEEEKN